MVWYGLKESRKIDNDDMVALLKEHGDHQARHTSGLFTHETRDISFTLAVNNFGVTYTNKEDVDHLLAALD